MSGRETAAIRESDDGRLPPRRILFAGLAVAWLVGSLWLLLALQSNDQRLFDPSVLETADFPAEKIEASLRLLLPDTGTTRIVHAWDNGCGCAEAAWQHLISMQERIEQVGAQVVLLARPDDEAEARAAALGLTRDHGIAVAGVVVDREAAMVPASPAALVVGPSGRLIYLGPYSAGEACVSTFGGFVESSLRVALQPPASAWINRAAMGCYCDWRATSVAATP